MDSDSHSRVCVGAPLIGRWLLAATTACAAGAPVSLQNPGFENGAAGWRQWVARTPTKVDTVEGPHGMCLRALGEAGSRVVVSQAFTAAPQRWHTVRYRYRAVPNGASGGCMGYCRIAFTDPNGKFIDYPNTRPLLDTFGEWTEASQSFKTPLSIGKVTIGFNQSGAADLRIDDVSLELSTSPAPRPNTWEQLTRRRRDPLVFSSWQYTNSASHFRQMGLKYGWRYRLEEQYRELKESRTVAFWGGDEAYARLAKHGVKACPYIYWGAKKHRDAHYGGKPPEDLPYILDPVWHDGYVAACRKVCQQHGRKPGLEYVFVQDESYQRFKSAIGPADKRVSSRWAEIDDEVRADHGGGRFGLPTGPEDDNVYRWVAYYSWVQDTWADTFARLRQVIDESGCGAKLLGPDEVGILKPLPWCDLAESVDVFTGQCLYSRGSARTYIAGFTTKYSRDLTGKPVHNATQVVKYSGSPPPEEVQRQYSQVLRNGGEGQMLIGVEWFDRELNHHRYSAPARWATIKNLLRLMSEYEVQTPRTGTVALLYSSVSGMAQGRSFSSNEMLAAYATCAPKLRAWPIVVDSYALGRGKASLAEFRTVVLPYAPYETSAVFAQFQSFVRGGGQLVCADPGALRTDELGHDLDASRFLGATPKATDRQRLVTVSWPGQHATRLRVYAADCFVLEPATADTRIVGRYADGTSAVTLTPFGDGQVLMFGANPFGSTYVSEDPEWVSWWEQVLGTRGVETNLPIWDLRLPDEALVQARKPDGVCLTGNNFVRCQNGVYLGANDAVDGYYTMSVAPDLAAESATGRQVAFAHGDLTDRVQATKGPFDKRGMAETPYGEADWADRWSAHALGSPLDIEFVLPEARPLARIVLWYSGSLDTLTVSGRAGEAWKRIAEAPGEDVGADVVDLTVPVAGSFSRVRLRFDSAGKELAIADVEVWAMAN